MLYLTLTPCRGGEACVSQGPNELCQRGLMWLAGLTIPGWFQSRGLTKNTPWSSKLEVGQWFNNLLPENLLIMETKTSIATASTVGKKRYTISVPSWSSIQSKE